MTAFPGPEITGTPTTLGVELEHTPGFAIDFKIFIAFGVLKLFNLSASAPNPLLQFLNIDVQSGPFTNSLSSPIGGGPSGMAFNRSQEQIMPNAIEVILGPPLDVA